MNARANPYAPPKAHVHDVVQASSEAEEVRQEHIKHETSIRAVGLLYYIGGALLLIASIGLLAGGVTGPADTKTVLLILGAVYLVFGAGSIVIARGLRALKPWARVTGIVFSAIGLLGFPIGTLINAYVLWLLASQKGKRIFEDDYPGIVEATPHIKYRTPLILWILLGVLLLGVAAAIIIPLLNR
jgi:hypothetical protein